LLGIQESETSSDTSKHTKTGGTSFNRDLFESDSGDSETVLKKTSSLGFDPVEVLLFNDSTSGTCSLSLFDEHSGIFIRSAGIHRKQKSIVLAKLSGHPFYSSDTVLYVETQGLPEGSGSMRGSAFYITSTADTAGKSGVSRFEINSALLSVYLKQFQSDVRSDTGDTLKSMFITTVRTQKQFDELPLFVKGHLVIESSFNDSIDCRDKKIQTTGNIQVQKSVIITNAALSAGGEFQMLDNAKISSSSIFSRSRMFFSGRSEFSGSATAMNEIEIFNEASVINKSLIVCAGSGGSEKKDSSAAHPGYAIHVRNRASVDACITDATQKGIECGPSAVIRGILWSRGDVCLMGLAEGVIRARKLTSSDPDSRQKTQNTLEGRLSGLDNVSEWPVPFFIGRPSVSVWREMSRERIADN
jgi:hypothetical protein